MGFIAELSEVCRRLLTLAGLSLFLEVLLPAGELKKYAQFVMGLLLTATLLDPLAGFSRGLAPQAAAGVFAAEPLRDKYAAETERILAAGAGLDELARLQAAEELKGSLERQIASLLSLSAGVAESRVEVRLNDAAVLSGGGTDGHNWGQVVIVLTVAADAADEAESICREVRQAVAGFYDIEPTSVQVSLAAYGESVRPPADENEE